VLSRHVDTIHATKVDNTHRYDVDENKEKCGHSANPHGGNKDCQDKRGDRDARVLLPPTGVTIIPHGECEIPQDAEQEHDAKGPRQPQSHRTPRLHAVAVIRTVVVKDAFKNRQHARHVRHFLKGGKVALTARIALDLVQQTGTLVVHEAVALDPARVADEIVLVAAASL